MKKMLESLREASRRAIEEAVDMDALEALRVRYLGKKGELTAILKQMGKLSAEERPVIGQLANEVRGELESGIESRKSALAAKLQEAKLRAETLDVTMPGKEISLGKKHVINTVLDEVVDIFIGMGFSIVDGPEIELSNYDFDRLNIPENHTVREWTDTFYITEDEKVHLRCQTSPVQVRVMESTRPPIRILSPGRVYRKDEVDAIEAVTNHDVIAFLTNMGSYIDKDVPEGSPKPSRWVHYGMTSSDLGDTALCYQLVQATDILIEDCKKLGEICKRRAFEERDTLCVGRTHGIHAEPMTFGMKFGSWAWELKRDLDRLRDARNNVAFGAISGAVGTYSSIDPRVEEYVCEHLGLTHDPLSTQVISRDHHAYLAGVLATTAATCERIATGIRNLQKTDTLEGILQSVGYDKNVAVYLYRTDPADHAVHDQ